MIQIRNVPEDVHRALQKELRRLSVTEVVARVRELGPIYGAPAAADIIREERDIR